jgi:serine/threonine protein kinase
MARLPLDNVNALVLFAKGIWKIGDYSCDLTPDGTLQGDHSTQATLENFEVKCYWAPEMVESDCPKPFSASVDIWALGCILYQLASGKNVLPDTAKILTYVGNKHADIALSPLPQHVGGITTSNLVMEILKREEKDRPPASVLLEKFKALAGPPHGTTSHDYMNESNDDQDPKFGSRPVHASGVQNLRDREEGAPNLEKRGVPEEGEHLVQGEHLAKPKRKGLIRIFMGWFAKDKIQSDRSRLV